MTETLIFKLVNPQSFNLSLNKKLPKFTLICELLSHHGIPFETWCPNSNDLPEPTGLCFTADCRFQDVYLLVYLLNEYGIEHIYPTRNGSSKIMLGTYLLPSILRMEDCVLAQPITIHDFLTIDPKLNTKDVIDNYFENHLVHEGESDSVYDHSNDYDYDNFNNDSDRDYFDAMTDGQLGNYNDFGGDMDDVDTWSRG